MKVLVFLQAFCWISVCTLQSAENIFTYPLGSSTIRLLKTDEIITITHAHTTSEHKKTIKSILEKSCIYLSHTLFNDVFCACACVHTHTTKQHIAGVLFYHYAKANPKIVFLRYIGVAQHQQKKGIGTALINYVQQVTRCHTIQALVVPSAIDFYTKLEFTRTHIPFVLQKFYR